MNHEQHQQDLRALRRQNSRQSLITLLTSGGLLVALLIIFSILGTEKVVVVPPDISKTFWVSKEKASREYLEEMAAFVAWLQLDVSPSTIDWKRDQLLKYVPPDDYAEAKKQMDIEAERLRRNNASTFFQPQQLTADENDQSVRITGRLRRQINGTDVGDADVHTYVAKFQYAGGRVHITTFKEVANVQPGQVQVGAAATGAAAR